MSKIESGGFAEFYKKARPVSEKIVYLGGSKIENDSKDPIDRIMEEARLILAKESKLDGENIEIVLNRIREEEMLKFSKEVCSVSKPEEIERIETDFARRIAEGVRNGVYRQ